MDRNSRGGRSEEEAADYAGQLDEMGFKYSGCYGAESFLGKDKVYGGGPQASCSPPHAQGSCTSTPPCPRKLLPPTHTR